MADHILDMSGVKLWLLELYFLKLGLQINAADYFNDQRRPSSRLASVLLRGTPCSYDDVAERYPN